MQPYIVHASVLKDPEAGSRLQLWLGNATSQQRQVCLKLLSSLNGGGCYLGTASGPVGAPSRPSTASGCRGSSSLTAEGQKCMLTPRRPQTAGPTLRNAPEGAPDASSTHQKQANVVSMQANAWITMNDQFYGFRKLYPSIYNAAAVASRAVPAPNMLFTSEYADSLKRGAGPYWRRFLQTTNQLVNESIYPSNMENKVRLDPSARLCSHYSTLI